MSRIKIFVESQDEKTWEEICDDVATGKTNYIDFKGVVFNRVKHGHWTDNGHIGKRRWCSVCGGIAFEEYDDYGLAEVTETDYCPHCGAKMDEKVEQ